MDRKLTKQSLHEKEIDRRYQSLLDNFPGMAFRCLNDKDWTMEFVSKGCKAITGYSVDAFMEMTDGKFNLLIHPNDQNKVFTEVSIAVSNGQQYEIEYRIISRSKKIKWVLEKGQLIKDLKTNQEYIEGFKLDITEKKRAEDKLKKIIRFDQATGLANRAYLNEFLNRRLNAINENTHKTMVVVISINRHDKVRELYSETGVQSCYKKIAKLLQKNASPSDFIAFIDNRYFVYVTTFIKDELYDLEVKIEETLESIASKSIVNKLTIEDGLSAGISLYPDDATMPDDLINKAIFACNQVNIKCQNKTCLSFYDERKYQRYKKHLRIENDIISAMVENQFYLVYQPIVNIQTNCIHALEALIRWDHPEFGLIPPSCFIPIAEHTGLIDRLENWIIEHALRDFHEKILPQNNKVKLSINVSPTHLRHNEVKELFSKLISEFLIDKQKIIIEITETSLDIIDNSNPNIKYFIQNGVSLAIDDFGIGQSSLERLVTIPFKKIKLDKSLVDKIYQKNASFLIKNIIIWGNHANVKIVAEGIEEKEQLQLLIKYGCHLGQGYLLAKPMPISELLINDVFLNRKYDC